MSQQLKCLFLYTESWFNTLVMSVYFPRKVVDVVKPLITLLQLLLSQLLQTFYTQIY